MKPPDIAATVVIFIEIVATDSLLRLDPGDGGDGRCLGGLITPWSWLVMVLLPIPEKRRSLPGTISMV